MSIIDHLLAELLRLAGAGPEKDTLASVLHALDDQYALAQKMTREPALEDIMIQLAGRIYRAFGGLVMVKGKRILDLACGSRTSKAPAFVFVDTLFGERRIPVPHTEGYTAQFEPWFCRLLLEAGAEAVGMDVGNLEGERFEYYQVDLGQPGALDFLPEGSFDGVQDSRLFGSPEFTAQFPRKEDRLRVAGEIWRQEQRVLKPGGVVIHSDAAQLLKILP